MNTSVVIGDRSIIFLRGLRDFLDSQKQINVVAEASTSTDVLKYTAGNRPDLLLLEISLGGVALIESVTAKSNGTKVLVLAEEFQEDTAFQSLLAGARGYILKTTEPKNLTKSIRSVVQGELWVPRSMIEVFIQRTISLSKRGSNDNGLIESLSPRKREIVMLASRGLSNKEIASELSVSESTVKVHLYHIFKNLGIHKRNELIPFALRLPPQ